MKDVQCKKKGNQVIPVSEAVKDHFEDHNSCISCQDYDKCREENEQNEVEWDRVAKIVHNDIEEA